MIVDAHAHAIPFLGDKGIFNCEAEHRASCSDT